MSLPSVSNIPINAPFFDENGNISRVWVSYLAGLAPQLPVPVQLIDGDNGDVFVGSSPEIVIVGPVAPFTIAGFSASGNGQRLHVLNYTGQTMTLKNLSAAVPAGDQIITMAGVDLTLAGHSSVAFIYYNVSLIADVNPPGAWVLVSKAP